MPYLGKSPSFGVRQRYQYTATASQTTFSGTDTENLTLNYTDNNFVDVYQNGVLLKGGGNDYTATSGTSVVLGTGATADDVIEIIVYDAFSAGNFYSRTDSDSRYLNVAGDTMTGSLDLNGTELVLDVDGDTSITADTDDQIDIKIAGSDKLKIDASSHLVTTTAGTSNLVLGVNAGNSIASGGNYNVCIGDEAGTALTTGGQNTAIGFEALKTEDAHGLNTAVGYQALKALDAGTEGYNTAVGNKAGTAMTTGTTNTLVGSNAGDALTNGGNNVAIGAFALSAEDGHSFNVAVGSNALLVQNTGGDGYNVAVGHNAGKGCTTGTNNTFIGGLAGGDSTQTGANNVAVGYAAGFNLTSGANNILIGKQSGRSGSPSGQIDTESNTVCLGDDNISDLFCADSSISTSDSRDKTDITDFSIGLNWIKDLRPVTYQWDKRSWYGTEEKPLGTPDGSKKGSKVNIGFLAQEVLEVEKANGFGDSADTMLTCNLTNDGQRYGMKYERLIPILVNAVKELSAKNDALEARIKKLEDG